MASQSIFGVPFNGTGNDTIGATTVGVTGPDSKGIMVIFCLPAGAAGNVTMTSNTAVAATAGGLEVVAGTSSQMLPCGNLNLWKAWAGSGTITINAITFR